MAMTSDQSTRGKPITGRTVLACFLGFFGIVFVANFFLVRAAVTSFGGVETASSYQAGLEFTRESAAAQAQDARHWQVAAHLAGGEFDVSARDAAGQPLTGLDIAVRLHHPTDRRLDQVIEPERTGAGQWHADTTPPPGQWDLVIELSRDGERLFRSSNRVVTR